MPGGPDEALRLNVEGRELIAHGQRNIRSSDGISVPPVARIRHHVNLAKMNEMCCR